MSHQPPDWLKPKGYIHITPQLNVQQHWHSLVKRITNRDFVATYAFYPLIYDVLKERKYKRYDKTSNKRAHSFIDPDKGVHKRGVKERPLHYATHFDAQILSYYSHKLLERYEARLANNSQLSASIIAYRKIPVPGEERNKGTGHFSKEVFDEIRTRCEGGQEVAVLAFDIEKFFPSLNHELLQNAWKQVMGHNGQLPKDEQNVFNAATSFSYILRDDFRVRPAIKGRKAGFDERDLARIRNEKGAISFFDSPKAFRSAIKEGKIRIHRFPFGKGRGIPQGLPISSTLANIYLLGFDEWMVNEIVEKRDAFYRRYSDDIVVVCPLRFMDEINHLVTGKINDSKLNISKAKTEQFIFRWHQWGKQPPRLTSFKEVAGEYKPGLPLNYLGFAFDGGDALLKSSNLSRFYRRMIYSVKSKANIAKKTSENNPDIPAAIYLRQLNNIYQQRDLHKTSVRKRWKRFAGKNLRGRFVMITGERKEPIRGNYLGYVERSAGIFGSDRMRRQIRKHKAILRKAMEKHWISKQKNNE